MNDALLSAARALWTWTPPPLYYAAIHFVVTRPTAPPVDTYGLDKLAHVAAYAVLGALLIRARPGAGRGAIALFLLVGAGLGAFDEWSQSSVPGRDASIWDWLADVIGVSIGLRFGEYIWKLPEFSWFRADRRIPAGGRPKEEP